MKIQSFGGTDWWERKGETIAAGAAGVKGRLSNGCGYS